MRRTLLTLFFLAATMILSARHRVVIISLDGCRWDYPQMYDTPFLDSLASAGVSGSLIPSFPSKTFPNHYTLATGLRPEHHGIIANSFYHRAYRSEFSLSNKNTKNDPRYWGGEPIWVTAKKQGVSTAVFHWPGSDVKICGMYPDEWYDYETAHLTEAQREEKIVETVNKSDGATLVMAYFEQPDGNGHNFGPQAKETRWAMQHEDSVLHRIYNGIRDKRSVDFIVVSDHGMSYVLNDHVIRPGDYLKPAWINRIEGNLPANIYASSPAAVDSIVEALQKVDNLRVWKKTNVPARLHYSDNPNIGDVVVLPDIGFIFQDEPTKSGGTHGWDPAMIDMHAVFRALGPSFNHAEVGHFSNTAIYPLLCRLLGLQPAPNDGSIDALKAALR